MQCFNCVCFVTLGILLSNCIGQQHNAHDRTSNVNQRRPGDQFNAFNEFDRSNGGKPMNVPNSGAQPGLQTNGNTNMTIETVCHLHPQDSNLVNEVAKLIQDDVKLIQFTFTFPEYEINPLSLTHNNGRNYKSDVWQRVFDEHGRNLLALKFNYDILSLSLLTFGVEKMDVAVIDAPPRFVY